MWFGNNSKDMKVRKKKILGVSVLDVFVLTVIASLVIGLVKFYKREDQWRMVRMQVTNQYQQWWLGTPYWIGENIKVGDIERGSGGETIAEVIDIDDFERGDETRDVYLVIKVKGFYDGNKNKFIYKNRPIEVGASIELHLDKALISGVVVNEDYKEEKVEKEWLEVKLRWSDVFPWQAEKLRYGLKMKANDQKEVAEILSVNSQLSRVTTETAYGYLRVSQDPLKRDVVLTLKLLAEKHGSEYFFAGHQKVKVGEPLWVYFPEVDVDMARSGKLSVMEVKPYTE